jgi:lambda family phage tail tape measure protein
LALLAGAFKIAALSVAGFYGAIAVGGAAFLIGKWLSEEYKSVQKFGLDVIFFFKDLWTGIKGAWELGTIALRHVFKKFWNWLKKEWAAFMLDIGQGLLFLRDATKGKMDFGGAEVTSYAISIIDGIRKVTKTLDEELASAAEAVAEDLVESQELYKLALESLEEDFADTGKKNKASLVDPAEEARNAMQSILDAMGDDLGGYTAKLEENEQAVQDMLDDLQMEIDLVGESNAVRDYRMARMQMERAVMQAYGEESERAMEKLLEFDRLWEELSQKQRSSSVLKQSLTDWVEDSINIWDDLGNVMTSTFDRAADVLAQFIVTGKADFRAFAQAILSDLLKIIIKMQMAAILKSMFGLPITAAANGAVLSSGGVTAMASGGIIPSPTLIPMAQGAALVAEERPEAVMPLGRDSHGRLGVFGEQKQPVVNTKIVNVFDKGELIAAMQTDEGEEVIMNTLRRNGLR